MPKLFVGESFTVALNSCIEKVWIRGGGGESRFSVENFSSHSAENFRRRILYCCTKFGYRKSLEKRGGEVPTFSVENVLCHSAENLCRGIFYCFINFGYRKGLDNKWGVSRFSVENFCLTVPKLNVVESFTNAFVSGSENVWIERGSIMVFRRSFFVSHCRKFPKGSPLLSQ